MKNLIYLNRDALKQNSYIRKADPKNKYWGDFSASKMEKFREATNDNFDLIVYGDENVYNDYYIIPFKAVKDKFTEKSFSKDKDAIARRRWVFTIDNHKLKVSNAEGTLDLKEFYSIPLKSESKPSVIEKITYNYKSILKEFSKIETDSNQYFKRYLTSLITKPFVIITGNSGTGKTRIARIIARWLSRETYTDYAQMENIYKGKTLSDGFYWQVEAYHINLDRIVFKKEFADQFFLMPKYENPGDIKIIIENKTYKCRFRCSSNGSPHAYGLKEIKDWLNSVGIGNLFKVSFLPEEEGFLNVIQFEKVKEDIEIERSIQYYALVPVGADWTDNRNIIGYYNPIKEVYQATPILDLIINAKDNPDKPFFLILDEMNLSHVERYFSDFLSGMESGEELTLHSESESVQSTSGKRVPTKIKFPTNLFITGTVNIDETTYMFSPKVLDRANVIEFIVSEEDILQSFKVNQSENNDANADDEIKDSFIDLAEKLKEGKTFSLPETDQTNIQNTILDLFRILKTAEMEFAFRTTNEIIRYANASFQLEENFNWEKCMDEQILQKLLPKLHGSRKKIEKLIVALLEYSHSGELKKSLERIESNTELKFDDNHKFKNSFTKLEKMLKSLKQDGFVSFIQ